MIFLENSKGFGSNFLLTPVLGANFIQERQTNYAFNTDDHCHRFHDCNGLYTKEIKVGYIFISVGKRFL